MKFAVIISTYNSPAWLEKVLWGYENQTDKNFDIIIADDGSDQRTKALIDQFKQRNTLNLLHVWHEDNGFQKTIILNKAIEATDCDYLMFTDGDCIPRNDTITAHKRHAQKGHFCSAGYFKLSMNVSELIDERTVKSGLAFNYAWLVKNGLPKTYKSLKLTARGWKQSLLNMLTPAKATWNGANSSGFKQDIIAVNGFDERLQYGGEDREMGERMVNNGIKGKQIRYSTICIHLDHKRGYESADVWKINDDIRKSVAANKRTWTAHGINKD